MCNQLHIRIAGQGTQDDRIRLRKRLACAARGLGLTACIDEVAEYDGQLRAILDNEVITEGVAQTEEIEKSLKDILSQ